MTLAERVHTISPAVRNRILILDVERLPGITQQSWWDRGDLKNRYVHHETVTREPRTTIACAKWYDQPDVIRLAEWDKGGRGAFLKAVHTLMSEADIIVGHNVGAQSGQKRNSADSDARARIGLLEGSEVQGNDDRAIVSHVYDVGFANVAITVSHEYVVTDCQVHAGLSEARESGRATVDVYVVEVNPQLTHGTTSLERSVELDVENHSRLVVACHRFSDVRHGIQASPGVRQVLRSTTGTP